jgi:hypothetical protein
LEQILARLFLSFDLKDARSRPRVLAAGFLVCSVSRSAKAVIVKVAWLDRDYFIERFDRKQKNKAKICVANSMNTEMMGATVTV